MMKLWRIPSVRTFIYQSVVVLSVIWLALIGIDNALTNIARRGVSTGFGFLKNEAGISIPETPPVPHELWAVAAIVLLILFFVAARRGISHLALVPAKSLVLQWTLAISVGLAMVLIFPSANWTRYTPSDPFYIVLLTGMLNSLQVGAVAFVVAVALGFFLGICELSTNWLLRTSVRTTVELLRNVPILLHMFFWYTLILGTFPPVRQSLNIGNVAFLSHRGIYYSSLTSVEPHVFLPLLVVSAGSAVLVHIKIGRAAALVVFVGLLALSLVYSSTWQQPTLRGFNFVGGNTLSPEFTALLLGLIIYYGAFIADIVRSGLRSVAGGQWEAARALGLSRLATIRRVIVPQALRVIIPPLSNQMLGLAKDTSIGVAIAYPEFLSISRTIINQTGQAMEVMILVLGFYLAINLIISTGMNIYNSRVRIRER